MSDSVGLAARETGLPVAGELAEMLLSQIDLANSLRSLTIWAEMHVSRAEEDERAEAIRGSLFRDGITQFVGCFDSKNAFPLVVESVFPNVDGIDGYFRWLRSLRNSYTAHRHGAARQCSVGAIINPETGEYISHAALFAVYAGPSKEGHGALLGIVKMALLYIENRIAALERELEAAIRAIPAAERLKMPAAMVQAQGAENMGKSRGDVRRGIERERSGSLS